MGLIQPNTESHDDEFGPIQNIFFLKKKYLVKESPIQEYMRKNRNEFIYVFSHRFVINILFLFIKINI